MCALICPSSIEFIHFSSQGCNLSGNYSPSFHFALLQYYVTGVGKD